MSNVKSSQGYDALWRQTGNVLQDHIFHNMKDIIETIKFPKMEKCRLRVFFKFPDMNSWNVFYHFK